MPGLLPTRTWLLLHTILGMSSHWKPLFVPLQEPVCRWVLGQSLLLQAWHVPGLLPSAPDRYCPWLHNVQSLQLVTHKIRLISSRFIQSVFKVYSRFIQGLSKVATKCHDISHLVAVLVVPLYLPPVHVLHVKPSVVPLQDPLRYFPLKQLTLEHVLHVNLLVVPLQEPVLY